MPSRRLKLLHVEDNLAHRRLIHHYLNSLKDEFTIDLFQTDNEEAAVETFRTCGIEFVILDYHLSQGDGLSCLRKLRGYDPLVPIVALSGAATPEIAAELLEVGADDYLSKQDLSRDGLAAAMRAALSRVDMVRQPPPPKEVADHLERLNEQFVGLCTPFLKAVPPEFVSALDDFAAAARKEDLQAWHLQRFFTQACEKLDDGPHGKADLRLRPLLLELVLRIFGQLPFGDKRS
jgi:CheY-like chemotaxis protein